MLASLIIVFREVLEAGLIVGVVLAATEGVPRRGRWVSGGIVGGVAGAAIVALFAGAIASAFSGVGQEVFNAVVLLLAVVMLTWHNVWMSSHGRELSAQVGAVGKEVTTGERPLYAVGVVVGVAVLREGSEVVLFLYGIAASAGGTAGGMILGSVIGIALGAAVTALLYFGLLRIPARHLFTVTSWLITLLAAGMASSAAAYLGRAGILPTLVDKVWDTSWLLANSSLIGKAAHVLMGYSDRPSAMQLIAYVTTLVIIVALMRRFGTGPGRRPKARQDTAAA